MNVDSRTFRKALGCFATGINVVTTKAGDGAPLGVTISAFSSVSLEPPIVLFCLDKRNANVESFQSAGHFAVNILRDTQKEVSIRFASRSEDKWQGVEYDTWDSGVPILRGCLAVLECSALTQHDGGDHLIFLGRVDRLNVAEAGQPLLYFRGAYAELGTAPLP